MPELVAVAVDLVNPGTNRVFTYSVPPELAPEVRCGTMVQVSFNRQRVTGYVVPEPAPLVAGIRPVDAVLATDLFTPDAWELVRWLSRRYVCHLVEALRLVLPPLGGRGGAAPQPAVRLALTGDAAEALSRRISKRAPAQARLLTVLVRSAGPLPYAQLLKEARARAASLQGLLEQGAVSLVTGEAGAVQGRLPTAAAVPAARLELTPAQAAAVAAISAAVQEGRPQAFLLHGVTGSGKTEVYLRALADALAHGRGGLVLVPEIALTPQTLKLFTERFGGTVAVLHSALNPRVRYAEWERIRCGEARVVVGARSALFAPLPKPGLIILDEEHEPAYKQEESPRYQAREVARWLAERAGAVLVLGSATPAVETYRQAEEGRYRLLTLPERIARRPLPEVTVVDMRAELAAGNRSIFSRDLEHALREAVGRGEQAILFLNRRGHSTFILCRQCGLVATCPHCDLALTLHLESMRLVCHHCGYTARPYHTCPRCGSRRVRDFGCGTERVAQEAARVLPEARILRLDGDTTTRRGAHDRILTSFARHEADVLVGTQMVAKGLDFTRVSLVGIVSADLSLHLPDPYAWERTFQLLEQVAGRTGRGEAPGRVILQTYNPDHPSIVCARRHDYQGFYRLELNRRRRYRYPPFVEVVLVRAAAPQEEVARGLLAELTGQTGGLASVVEGPAPCPFLKMGGEYRWQVIFKGGDLRELRDRLAAVLPALSSQGRQQEARISVDVDPLSYL